MIPKQTNLVIVLFFASLMLACADELHLKDGSYLEGEVLRTEADTMFIITPKPQPRLVRVVTADVLTIDKTIQARFQGFRLSRKSTCGCVGSLFGFGIGFGICAALVAPANDEETVVTYGAIITAAAAMSGMCIGMALAK